MAYECVQARFLFFNGKFRYTVEFAYGLSAWYVFKDEEISDAVFNKKVNPAKSKTQFFPESGYSSGITIKSGHGFENLLNQIRY